MKYFLLCCSTAIIVSCQNEKKEDTLKSVISSPDSIITAGNQELTARIKTAKVLSIPYNEKIITSGIVKAIPNNYAEIASPFSGRITRSFVTLGQRVEVGSPVFEISSPQFFETGKNFYQSKQEMILAEKNYKRQQDLLKNGVGTQKDLEEAEVNYELTKRDFENSVASLNVYRVDPEDLVLGQPLIIRSPIRGEVVENKIVIGQYLKEDAGPVAIVAELSKVYVIGQLKEKDVNSVHQSDEVEIRMTGMPEVQIKGKIFHIGDILDESTRSAQVYVLCENRDLTMKPGMFVTSTFFAGSRDAILIPSNSIYQMEGSSFVFVSLGNDKYLKRKIEPGGTDSNRVIIKDGLKKDEEIVVEGGSLLMDIKY
jgi:membrane fusion protein, heavy metal efflux system